MVVYLAAADKYRGLTHRPSQGAKRPRREGSQSLPAALSPLVTPSTPAVWTHGACSGHLPVPLPITRRAHTPAGCGHGGTRKSKTSRKLQTWSVNPAAMAGVWRCQRLVEPLPLVSAGWGNGRRKLAWGKQKSLNLSEFVDSLSGSIKTGLHSSKTRRFPRYVLENNTA